MENRRTTQDLPMLLTAQAYVNALVSNARAALDSDGHDPFTEDALMDTARDMKLTVPEYDQLGYLLVQAGMQLIAWGNYSSGVAAGKFEEAEA